MAHGLAALAVAGLVFAGLLRWLALAAMALLLARAAYGLSPFRPRVRTVWLGVSEIAFGVITVLAVASGLR